LIPIRQPPRCRQNGQACGEFEIGAGQKAVKEIAKYGEPGLALRLIEGA
jgi:hypothetical protein